MSPGERGDNQQIVGDWTNAADGKKGNFTPLLFIRRARRGLRDRFKTAGHRIEPFLVARAFELPGGN